MSHTITSITCAADLADYFGGEKPDEASLSKRLFKATDCGAWLELFGPGRYKTGDRREVWILRLRRSIRGVYCMGGRRAGGRSVPPADLPEHVRGWLLLGKGRRPEAALLEGTTWAEVQELKIGDDIQRRTTRCLDCWLTAEIPAPVYRHHGGGVCCGSIVEGSEACARVQELYYPFASVDFERAVEMIEADVDEIIALDEIEGPYGPTSPRLPRSSRPARRHLRMGGKKLRGRPGRGASEAVRDRNLAMAALYTFAGWTYKDLAAEFAISPQRAHKALAGLVASRSRGYRRPRTAPDPERPSCCYEAGIKDPR